MGTGLNRGPAPSGWFFEEGIGGHLARASLQGAWAGGIFPAGSGTKMLAQAFDAGPAAPGLGRRPGGTGPGRAPTDRELEVLGKLAAARRTRRSPKSFLSPFTVKHVGQILASSAWPAAPKPLRGTRTGPIP
jgi:hypothetical protein